MDVHKLEASNQSALFDRGMLNLFTTSVPTDAKVVTSKMAVAGQKWFTKFLIKHALSSVTRLGDF